MSLQIKKEINSTKKNSKNPSQPDKHIFLKNYEDYLSKAGWRLER